MATAPDPRRLRAERRREIAQQQRIVIHVNDDGYEIRPSELTPALIGELRRTAGYTFLRLMLELHQEFDIDVAAVAVWLARRARGDVVTLAEVQRGISWDDVIWATEVEDAPEQEDADDPPVSGGD